MRIRFSCSCLLLSIVAATASAAEYPLSPSPLATATDPADATGEQETAEAITARTDEYIAQLAVQHEAERARVLAAASTAEAERTAAYDAEQAAIEQGAKEALSREADSYYAAIPEIGAQMVAETRSLTIAYNGATRAEDHKAGLLRAEVHAALERSTAVVDRVASVFLAALDAPAMAELAALLPSDARDVFNASLAAARVRVEEQRQQWTGIFVKRHEADLGTINASSDAVKFTLLTTFNADKAKIRSAAMTEQAALGQQFAVAKVQLEIDKQNALENLEQGRLAQEVAAETQLVQELAMIDNSHQRDVDAALARQQEQLAALEQAARRRALLSWTIPTTRVNGNALTMSDLAGYEIYYSSDDSGQSGVIEIAEGSQSSYTISELQPGKYFFAISAIDADGLKSELSAMVEAEIVQ